MIMMLEEVKLYLRVDGDEEDILIQSFILAASKEIQRRTGKTKVIASGEQADIADDALWQLAVKIGVADMYENRGSSSTGAVNQFSRTFDNMTQFIALCGDYV